MEDHTVRVSEDNLKRLKEHQDNTSLSYNDIIGMALNALDGIEQKASAEAPAYKIKVSLNRVKINDNVKTLLDKGYDLFIPDINHRQAMYIRRRLKSMGYKCDYVPGENAGKFGFLFSLPNEPSSKKKKPTAAPVSD